MKRITIGMSLMFGLGLGACDDGEPVELDQVELSLTEDGMVLVSEDGEELVVGEDDVELDGIDGLQADPESAAGWCCESCVCVNGVCGCTGCKEVPDRQEQ